MKFCNFSTNVFKNYTFLKPNILEIFKDFQILPAHKKICKNIKSNSLFVVSNGIPNAMDICGLMWINMDSNEHL